MGALFGLEKMVVGAPLVGALFDIESALHQGNHKGRPYGKLLAIMV